MEYAGCDPGPLQSHSEDVRRTEESELPRLKVLVVDCRQGAVRGVRFSVDGNYCITAGQDKTLKLWNPNKGRLLKTYSGHGYEVLDVRGSCDNSQLVSCSMDKTVMLWDVSSGNWTRRWRGHQAAVNCVVFNEDSSVAISGSVDTTVKVWDTRTRAQDPAQTMSECGDSVTSLDCSDHEILVGSADGKMRLYDLRKGSLDTDYVGGVVASLCFTRDGQCVLVSCVAETVKLFDKSSGEMLSEYTGHINRDYRLDCCLDYSDKHVLSGSENGQVYCWSLVEGGLVAKLDHGPGTVHSLAQHPAKAQLVTAMAGSMAVWQDGELEGVGQQEEEECLSSASVYDMKPHWM